MVKVQIVSMWRNDFDRQLQRRIDHLLTKRDYSFHADDFRVSLLWGVGDSTDLTKQWLDRTARVNGVELVDVSTGITGMSIQSRRLRMSTSANLLYTHIDPLADYVLMHESDLESPIDVVDRLYEASQSRGGMPVAGWPVIRFDDGVEQFYDTYAYRDLDGRCYAPHTARPTAVTEVSSFGSVWLAPAHLVRNRTMNDNCIVDLCRQWRDEGVRLYCDPSITITQPVHLWADTWKETVDAER